MLTLPKRDTFFTSLEPIKSETKDQFVNCKDSKEDKSIAALRGAVEAYSARKIKREEDERVQESNMFGIYESTFTDSNSNPAFQRKYRIIAPELITDTELS
ncbi:hypothetical protein RRG08_062799 [Elysia crispata]|uniref:Uncharacterized protein n=1 Tax=Elysia crispata TaxID=231223 RepID=A0AAE0ZB37_9GAST|nr:hypothetical protein RRG08_062799 [Elysia crispata]